MERTSSSETVARNIGMYKIWSQSISKQSSSIHDVEPRVYCSRRSIKRRLPISQYLDSGEKCGREIARARMDLWGRIRIGICSLSDLRWRGARERRNTVRKYKLQGRRFRFSFASRIDRGIASRKFRELWVDGSTCGTPVG